MQVQPTKSIVIAILGFAAGVAVSSLPLASAEDKAGADLAGKTFIVSIDEVRSNFVFGERFKGSYTHTAKLSDGSTRTIKLTPMLRNGMQVVELNDSGGITYMGLNGTTTNGKLMIQLRDLDEMRRQLNEQGWKIP